jgi:acyl-CoA reductase-like NAD-dependent aldehyde dehydrogenase
MTRIQMELGGKDPSYVCDDVDVVNTAKALADGAMYNTGQSCCSVERIYVHKNVYKQFVDEFVKETKTFKVGDPMEKDTYIGPLALPGQPAFLDHHTKDATSKGATVLMGGNKMEHPRFYPPTVLVKTNHYMAVMKEESFGPIIGIMEVPDDKEAIQLMNDTRYGLTAGVYTKDKNRAEQILSHMDAGTAYWNACDRVSPFVPWTGRRNSGTGATLGIEGILNFSRVKAFHWVG